MRPESRDEAHDPDLVKAVGEATGIFMTGGNQLKLSAIVCGTPLGDAIVEAHRRGAVVAGTSAGASIQSSHMVAFGVGGATPKQRMTQVAAGLGLVSTAVIDQHFDQRNRYGRLLMIVAQSPQLLGIGVDEDTCAVITHEADGESPREVLRVMGRGCVTILDPARIVSNAHEAKRSVAAARERRRPPRAPGGGGVRPDHAHAPAATRDHRPGGRRRDRRGPARHAPAGPRHRRRRRQPGCPA